MMEWFTCGRSRSSASLVSASSPVASPTSLASPTTFATDFDSDIDVGPSRNPLKKKCWLVFILGGTLAAIALVLLGPRLLGWDAAPSGTTAKSKRGLLLHRQPDAFFSTVAPIASSTSTTIASFTSLRPYAPSTTAYVVPKVPQNQYDEEEAKLYLSYAMASFCTEQHIKQWDCGPSCNAAPTLPNSVKFLTPGKSQVQGYVAKVPQGNHSLCLAAFRGSVNTRNWMYDLKFWSKSWPPAEWQNGLIHQCVNCEVHAGFADTYAELRDEVNKAFDSLSCHQFAFAGHSLGAGITTLAAMDARLQGRKVLKVYTFGSPLVGNAAFAETFNKVAKDEGADPPSWRIVHHDDWVPHLEGPFANFRHVDREVFYVRGSDGKDIVCKEGMVDPRCSAGVTKIALFGADHGSYLGQSVRVQDMPEQCTGKPLAGLRS